MAVMAMNVALAHSMGKAFQLSEWITNEMDITQSELKKKEM